MRSSFACLSSGLDVRPLLRSLETNAILWDQITARQTTPGSPHADTRTIFLRWAAAQTIEAVFNDTNAIDYPALSAIPEARSAMAHTASVSGAKQVGRAIIVSLKPGGRITPHIDEGAYADYYERFHMVLQSDFGNLFHVGGPQVYETCEMKTGELWWFNHKRTHWVENRSNRERIHLIMDMAAPNFRVEREQ